MASGAKVEPVSKPLSTLPRPAPARLKNSVAQLSTSSLAELCQRLRVQLIKQRLPVICPDCRPNLVRAFNMELNLTQMLRGLCAKCKSLFLASQVEGMGIASKPILPRAEVVKVKGQGAHIKKVILKMSPKRSKGGKKVPLRTDVPIFEALTIAGLDWCRYCGTTNGVGWRPGPWGQRSLCNKHGCAYNGYGFSKELPRLDLSKYDGEAFGERRRPVLQETCSMCQGENEAPNPLVYCHGCPKSFHLTCISGQLSALSTDGRPWYCSSDCQKNFTRRGVTTLTPLKSRSQRALSEPTPTLGKRKFAKRFDLFGAPPTPPSTPPSGGRKRRTTTDMASEVLVCFEPDTVMKRTVPDRKEVFTPLYQLVSFPPGKSQSKIAKREECLCDKDMLDVHSRYEEVEKTMRICRPEVLNTLFKGSFPASGVVSRSTTKRGNDNKRTRFKVRRRQAGGIVANDEGAAIPFFDRALSHMRGFGLADKHEPDEPTTTPTTTPTTVTIPYQPTTFDSAICSAYPEICRNAGLGGSSPTTPPTV